MRAYPLIFGFRELVAGNGFVAGVNIQGRALLKDDDGSWWLYGVEPGGISDYGATEHEAYQSFRQSFREVLYDSATLAADFDAFKSDVEGFCGQTNEAWAIEWERARDAIRSGAVTPEGDLVSGLPRQTKDVSCRVEVVRLAEQGRGISATDNSSEEPLLTAA
jgi:hypothetical protein